MMTSQALRTVALDQKHRFFLQVRQPILIVDDSHDDIILLSQYLKSFIPADKPIITLKGGRELLGYLANLEMGNIEAEEFEVEIPEMIFLDLLMPDMDGIQTLLTMRRQSIWTDVPVTLVTGSHDDIAIKRAENAGANAFLPKPFTKRDVMQALGKGNNFSSTIM